MGQVGVNPRSLAYREHRSKEYLPHFRGDYLICRKCLVYKPQDEFYASSANKLRNGKNTICKSCEQERKRTYRRTHIIEDLDMQLRWLIWGCKSRVKHSKRGYKKYGTVEITIDYLKQIYSLQKGLCAISGIPMTYKLGGGRQPLNISVDRIDNNKGYIPGNIQLVCSHVNMMRGNLSSEDLLEFCRAIVKNLGEI